MAIDIKYSAEGITIDGILVTWDTIDAERNKIRFADHVLVSIYWDNRRSQGFDNDFIMSKSEWAKWEKRLIGAHINFGEIDGKHSEVYGTVENRDIKVTDDLERIVRFHTNNGWSSGRVSFIGQYTEHVLDGSIEDPELLLEEFPKEYKRQYPNGHQVTED